MYYFKLLLFFLLLLISVSSAAEDKLIFAIDLIRHGDRTPLNMIPTVPYIWNEGMGELTAEGMQQEFQLGRVFYSRYINTHHLLPAKYKADTIEIRSTDCNRTYMSAQSLLLGLYPLGTGPYLIDSKKPALPSGYQPIPIHAMLIDQKTVLLPDLISKKKFHQLVERYVWTQSDWQAKNNALKNKFVDWSKATGISIDNIDQLIGLGDTLFIDQLHHVSLPPNLSAEDAKQIIEVGSWALAARFKPKEVGEKTGKPLLKTIINDLQKATESNSSLKYKLLSAHDSTILSVMSALQSPLDARPAYSSDLNFELFEKNPGNYYVKISFNDKPVMIPACGGDICSLFTLETLVN